MRHIICLEQLDESRGQTKLSGVFQECLSTYRSCSYPDGFNLHKHASDDELYILSQFIDIEIEFSKWKCV